MTHGPEDPPIRLSGWALILGASSGFGEATALALAGAGMSIIGVHLDRKATLPNAERIAAEVQRRSILQAGNHRRARREEVCRHADDRRLRIKDGGK